MPRLFLLPACVAILGAPVAPSASQAQSDPPVSYVASIKLNKDVEPRGASEYSPGGRYTATAITVAQLLRTAYRIQPYQLVGAPSWIGTKRYDIAAKADDNPAPSQQVLLRALLKDRFRLAVHNETREIPVFALVVARSDGKLGPQLTRSDFDCAAYRAGSHAPPEPGRTPNCATRINPGALYGKAIPMATLATSLAPLVSGFTVDKTGLTGGFDIEMTWTPDDTALNSSGPSIFSALQDQLGLKFVSEKGPVSVLVVDHLEEPSAN
jgi:uncharacterized protein (TIGR03435 family)